MAYSHEENWLAAVGEKPTRVSTIYPRGHLISTDVQEALDKQYGKGRFAVTPHGTAIVIYDYQVMSREAKEKWATESDEQILAMVGRYSSKVYQDALKEELERRGLNQ